MAQSNCPEKAAAIAPKMSPGSTQASYGPKDMEPRILSIDEEALDTENGNLQGTPTCPAMPKTEAPSIVGQESPEMKSISEPQVQENLPHLLKCISMV